jgi:Protein of unknown function (DUF3040)
MALSMEEQRILAEIEDELSRTEPVLAACLTMFSRPGRMGLLRASHARRHSPRVLAVASVIALFLLTVVPVLVYALVALHVTQAQPQVHPSASSAPHTATSVPR